MQTTVPPPLEDPSRELEALIEEARQRARRRRLAILAVVAIGASLIAGGVLLFGGGGGDGDSSGGTGPGDSPAAGNAPQASNSAAVSGYRCPTSMRDLRNGPPLGGGVPACKVTVSAELPAGWRQYGRNLFSYPPEVRGLMRYSGVSFANFDLPDNAQGAVVPRWFQLPKDGVILILQGAFPLRVAPGITDVNERNHVVVDGLEFIVQTRADAPVGPQTTAEIDSIFASLDTTQNLCPCGGDTPDP